MSETADKYKYPQYRSHKIVEAAKIESIHDIGTGACRLEFVDGYPPQQVARHWATRHQPQPGGYWVRYADGYTSYSPAEAFEAGYTRLHQK